MLITVELDREEDGRWIAEAVDFPGAMVYGPTQEAAIKRVQALALRCIADRLDNGEYVPGLEQITFSTAPHEPVAVC